MGLEELDPVYFGQGSWGDRLKERCPQYKEFYRQLDPNHGERFRVWTRGLVSRDRRAIRKQVDSRES